MGVVRRAQSYPPVLVLELERVGLVRNEYRIAWHHFCLCVLFKEREDLDEGGLTVGGIAMDKCEANHSARMGG